MCLIDGPGPTLFDVAYQWLKKERKAGHMRCIYYMSMHGLY